ncbi:MAG: hypothetical protein U0Y96_14235 [Candidatus Kapaibacterium sp.]|nr:hypothetical protein [Bacteroidota bacterium]
MRICSIILFLLLLSCECVLAQTEFTPCDSVKIKLWNKHLAGTSAAYVLVYYKQSGLISEGYLTTAQLWVYLKFKLNLKPEDAKHNLFSYALHKDTINIDSLEQTGNNTTWLLNAIRTFPKVSKVEQLMQLHRERIIQQCLTYKYNIDSFRVYIMREFVKTNSKSKYTDVYTAFIRLMLHKGFVVYGSCFNPVSLIDIGACD